MSEKDKAKIQEFKPKFYDPADAFCVFEREIREVPGAFESYVASMKTIGMSEDEIDRIINETLDAAGGKS